MVETHKVNCAIPTNKMAAIVMKMEMSGTLNAGNHGNAVFFFFFFFIIATILICEQKMQEGGDGGAGIISLKKRATVFNNALKD